MGAPAFSITAAPTPTIISGSRGSPILITAAGGITPPGGSKQIIFLAGNGGPVTVTANPQIVAGTSIGQVLQLQGCDAVNTVTIADGTGLELNGGCVLTNGSIISLLWTGTVWSEVSRNDI